MKFIYAKEHAKFMAAWKQEEKLLRSQKTSEETISEIYRYSLHQFNSDRNYYLHKEEFADENDLCEDMDLLKGMDFVEKVENTGLLKALHSLTEDELNIIKLHYGKKLSLLEISSMQNEKYDTIQKRLYRAKDKMKKYI